MSHRCLIVPPHLLAHLAAVDDPRAAQAARHTLEFGMRVVARRDVRSARSGREAGGLGGTGLLPGELRERARGPRTRAEEGATAFSPKRSVHDAQHGTTLPGTLVRSEGQPAVSDESANEAYDGLGATFSLFAEVYGRNSLDGAGLGLVASVHYDRDFDNAFWDGEQMVFGDGDGTYFNSFTDSVDVIGHELTHGVTQFTAGLTYVGQSGALNESVSDVFGSLVKQHTLGQTAEQADWLIGDKLFTDRVKGVALRSMKAPGTAYDDPHLGKDPQPADMDGYQDLPHDEEHDNGGVHINSGIPNRAFYLAATAIGGNAWDGAGRIWYDTLVDGNLAKDLDFAGFAAATTQAAAARFGDGGTQHRAVQQAWATVKVTPGG
ncbi:M4 family metallopeptidase [Luteipulveratus sp. YIM 133132]|uniref:Neutral metalloproteinase n=1 Tax=Luteipulveratus flavus TaxID=3031728 RepID=A0ABT6C343_9MICO|nr:MULTISPECIES: M4 family metallopeptidase [unclassified Luteipulveratus]MDE9367564.1 M4 family metallopeptidase [Luteipulveratus sp. YIM 133132]MDF8263371.1 M4 family metallopeptidase [Luteipulveratus sp. YIM 133296]